MRRKRGFFESSNPVLQDKALAKAGEATASGSNAGVMRGEEVMTVNGAVNKSLLLGVLLLGGAVLAWSFPLSPAWMWGSAIAGLILVLITSFRPHLSPVLVPIYGVVEGFFVGAVSLMYASLMDGIIFHAVTLTMAVFFLMLFIYKTGLIKVTAKFRTGVIMATGAVFLVYMVAIVLRLFGINMPFLHDTGPIGIGISLVIIGIASLNLLLDFDFFEKGAQHRAPAYMEWFAAMGLIITLVWLYLEILRLLAIFNSSD